MITVVVVLDFYKSWKKEKEGEGEGGQGKITTHHLP
jgi:hypothetical protein